MLSVQLKDNCWLCLGLEHDCAACGGSGEIVTWVTLDELVEQIEVIQKRKEEQEQFLATTDTYVSFNVENLDIPPNVNI